MIDLPETSKVYKRLPKELFYKYLNNDSASKKFFTDEIRSIIWINTLSPETITHPTGQNIAEIAIVEIILNRQAVSSTILEIINREIDQYAVFLVRYEEWGQLWCCDHQTLNPQTGLFNCQNYYQTNWMNTDDLSLKIDGMDLDQIYENFFIQIAGKPFPVWNVKSQKKNEEPIEKGEQAGMLEQMEKLEAAIKNLESQMGKEIQFGKQVKLATDLKMTREELQKIKRGMSTHIEIHQPEIVTTQEEKPEAVRAYFPNVYMKMQDNQRNHTEYFLI
ncbi:DUF4391 domain-containing protein [Acetobacterium wieringae]|uniref:DUF4391 domain-containing protein n=1 Tax=Acetobacterium wieringae TaxID=52694 RepID=UPI0026F230C7|nr:DUF4391 domain-containing protein [Acetobacterium wieringae]